MKLGQSANSKKIPIDMTPMIDCVFQLMIFFMLTLQIRADEGDFNVYMPVGSIGCFPPDPQYPELKVRLIAAADGSLGKLLLNGRVLGAGDKAYKLLNNDIINIVGQPGSAVSREQEVVIDADYNLRYQEVMKAIDAVTGKVDPQTGRVIRYIERVNFAPPRARS